MHFNLQFHKVLDALLKINYLDLNENCEFCYVSRIKLEYLRKTVIFITQAQLSDENPYLNKI